MPGVLNRVSIVDQGQAPSRAIEEAEVTSKAIRACGILMEIHLGRIPMALESVQDWRRLMFEIGEYGCST
jgi:hypothetical protein